MNWLVGFTEREMTFGIRIFIIVSKILFIIDGGQGLAWQQTVAYPHTERPNLPFECAPNKNLLRPAGPQEDHASVDILGRTTREDRIPAAHMYYSANARHSETIVWGQCGIMSGEEVKYTVLVMSMP